MRAEELRAVQAPLKRRYRDDPASAVVTLAADGVLDGDDLTCSVRTGRQLLEAGLHPGTGGSGASVCSGDLLLQALVACAGVTFRAVATSMGVHVRSGHVHAEGEVDFRGTLAVDRETPSGFRAIRVTFGVDTDADEATLARLLALTERYCVVHRTLATPPALSMDVTRAAPGPRSRTEG